MTKLALLRHGHTIWNREGRIQGRTDIPLDEEARAHLATRALPEDWQEAALVSSPLSRAAQTAELVGGRAVETIPALTEMDWGEWEGQHGTNLIEQEGSGYRHIEDWGWEYRPPGGESPQNVLTRLAPWVCSLKQDTIAVCHIGIMRVIMARATGWNFSGQAPFRIKRDRLFVLDIDGENWSVIGSPVRLTERIS